LKETLGISTERTRGGSKIISTTTKHLPFSELFFFCLKDGISQLKIAYIWERLRFIASATNKSWLSIRTMMSAKGPVRSELGKTFPNNICINGNKNYQITKKIRNKYKSETIKYFTFVEWIYTLISTDKIKSYHKTVSVILPYP
jgi:hypothetical protein